MSSCKPLTKEQKMSSAMNKAHHARFWEKWKAAGAVGKFFKGPFVVATIVYIYKKDATILNVRSISKGESCEEAMEKPPLIAISLHGIRKEEYERGQRLEGIPNGGIFF